MKPEAPVRSTAPKLSSQVLARLRNGIRRHLAGGWRRVVFARPSSGGPETDEIVVPGIVNPPSETELESLVTQAATAAMDGYVKQTFVIDDRTRVRIDARFGRAKVIELDAAMRAKVTGGKERALQPDTSGDLLRQIGIMNADGTISAQHAKKYKQVNHFVELCRPTWKVLRSRRKVDEDSPLRVIDLACGNSYLTFVLAEALRLEAIPSRITGVDVRADVIERSRSRAETLGWAGMDFEVSTIAGLPPDRWSAPLDLLVSLHACDTATDEALAVAIRHGAESIFAAPCCQHELAAQLELAPSPAIVRHGLFKQDYAAVLTDALRVEILEAYGYKVDLVEFVASEHSAKNQLIRAHRHTRRLDTQAFDAVLERCATLRVRPRLLDLLRDGDPS